MNIRTETSTCAKALDELSRYDIRQQQQLHHQP